MNMTFQCWSAEMTMAHDLFLIRSGIDEGERPYKRNSQVPKLMKCTRWMMSAEAYWSMALRDVINWFESMHHAESVSYRSKECGCYSLRYQSSERLDPRIFIGACFDFMRNPLKYKSKRLLSIDQNVPHTGSCTLTILPEKNCCFILYLQ